MEYFLILQILGAFGLLLLIFNLCAIIYIVKSYIIRLKIKSKFVLIFYGLSLVLTLVMMVQFVYNIFRPDYPPIDVDGPNKTTVNNLFESTIKVLSATLGYSIVATMFKIGVSVQCVLGEITVE